MLAYQARLRYEYVQPYLTVTTTKPWREKGKGGKGEKDIDIDIGTDLIRIRIWFLWIVLDVRLVTDKHKRNNVVVVS